MDSLPISVRYALDMLLLSNPPNDVEYVDQFLRRWRHITPQTLRSAVDSSDERDSLFALLSLPAADPVQARDILPRFLTDPRPARRWASALGLGRLQDERALPSLHGMLTEFLPPQEPSLGAERWYFRGWRFEIPELLAEWGHVASAPPLRNTLINLLRLEDAKDEARQSIPEAWDIDTLRRYEDVIVFTLGQLGVLGALTNVAAPTARIDLWSVHLIMGHLFHKHEVKSILKWSRVPLLQNEVRTLLEHIFGFDAPTCARLLSHYERHMAFTISEVHRKKRRKQSDHEHPAAGS